MEDTCCVVDKRKTPCVEPSSSKKIKETDFNFFVIVQFVHQKLLDMEKKMGKLEEEEKLEKGKSPKTNWPV